MLNTLLVLQPIDLCNLNCTYCYLPGRRDPARRSAALLAEILRKSLSASPRVVSGSTTLVWHGGEPLLAGIDFYRMADRLIQEYKRAGLTVAQAVQTNATLVTDEWTQWFAASDVSVSVSIDGPKNIHDSARVNWSRKGSFDEVMVGVECLRRNGIPLRAICVVSAFSLDYAAEIYHFFRDLGFEYLSFNIDEIEGANLSSSFGRLAAPATVDAMAGGFTTFLSAVYDMWERDGQPIWIREFNRTLDALRFRGSRPDAYVQNGETQGLSIITITKSGNISTFSPELSSGTKENREAFTIANITEIDSLDDLLSSRRLRDLARDVNEGTLQCAATCDYFDVCGGGSPSNKYFEHGSFRTTETAYCRLHKKAVVDVVLDKLSGARLSNPHSMGSSSGYGQ